MDNTFTPRMAYIVAGIATLSAVLASSDVYAITGTPAIGPAGPGVIVQGPNSATFVYGGTPLADIRRAYATASNAGAVAVVDTVRGVPGVPGSPVLSVSRTASRAAIAAAGAGVLRGLPYLGAGMLLWDLYDRMGIRPDGQGGLSRDPGTSTVDGPPVQCWSTQGMFGRSACFETPEAACAALPLKDGGFQPWILHDADSNGGTCTAPNPGTTNLSYWGWYGVMRFGESNGKTCPASIDPIDPARSLPAGLAPRPDGKCRTAPGRHTPVDPASVGGIADSFPSVQFGPDVAREIVDAGGQIQPDGGVTVSGPASHAGEPSGSTSTGPSGTTQTTVINITNYRYEGDTVVWTDRETTTTVGPGGESTTTTTDTKPPPTCGLPNTPACKIDETGTPTAPVVDRTHWDSIFEPLRALIRDPGSVLPKLPTIQWGFQLPTGCSAIPTPAFAPFLTEINICPYVPMFHEVMTIVWLLGGLFGAIQMFFRNALGYN